MADETEDDVPDIETPVGELPDLTEFGITEVDSGVCLDTPENRKLLRENKLYFRPVYTLTGAPTPYLQAFLPAAQEAHSLTVKSSLFSDVRDKNSEYLTGYDLILDDEASKRVPAWVLSSTRKWLDVERKREDTGKAVLPYLAGPPGRCVALKQNGTRCMNWHNGTAVSGMKCKMHIGRGAEVTVNYREKARNRMDSLSVLAVDELEKLLLSATSEPVRAKAAEMILDRVGIRAGMEIDQKVDVQVRPAADQVQERLQTLALAMQKKQEVVEDIIEAEVVEEKHDNG